MSFLAMKSQEATYGKERAGQLFGEFEKKNVQKKKPVAKKKEPAGEVIANEKKAAGGISAEINSKRQTHFYF